MNCNNCKVKISPEWNYCIKMNACPSCGGKLFSNEDISIMNLHTEHCKIIGELDSMPEKIQRYKDKIQSLPLIKDRFISLTKPIDVFDTSEMLLDELVEPYLCPCGITTLVCACKESER